MAAAGLVSLFWNLDSPLDHVPAMWAYVDLSCVGNAPVRRIANQEANVGFRSRESPVVAARPPSRMKLGRHGAVQPWRAEMRADWGQALALHFLGGIRQSCHELLQVKNANHIT